METELAGAGGRLVAGGQTARHMEQSGVLPKAAWPGWVCPVFPAPGGSSSHTSRCPHTPELKAVPPPPRFQLLCKDGKGEGGKGAPKHTQDMRICDPSGPTRLVRGLLHLFTITFLLNTMKILGDNVC